MSYFDIEPKKKKLENRKSKETIHYTYENGAHFKYINLYKSLIDLVNILPSERLGNDGIYFEEDEKENKDINKKINDNNNNINNNNNDNTINFNNSNNNNSNNINNNNNKTINFNNSNNYHYNNGNSNNKNKENLTDRKYKKITISLSKNKVFIKKQSLNPNRLIFKKDFLKGFINNSYNQNNLFTNYVNNNPKNKEVSNIRSYNEKMINSYERKKNIPFQNSFNINKNNKKSFINTDILKNKTFNFSGDENKKNFLPKINTTHKQNNDFDKKKILLNINPNFLSTKFILKNKKTKI